MMIFFTVLYRRLYKQVSLKLESYFLFFTHHSPLVSNMQIKLTFSFTLVILVLIRPLTGSGINVTSLGSTLLERNVIGNASAMNIKWDYDESLKWPIRIAPCGGEHQSPINIEPTKAINTDYPRLSFVHYDKVFPETVTNNGHTVTLQIHKDDGDDRDLPYIKDGGLSDRYIFYQLHFHWGSNNRIGSEHRIANKRYPAELHMVHYNSKYGTFSEALSHEDGLAVFGIMIELQPRDNIAFRHLEQFDNIIDPSIAKSDALRYSVPLSDLLPDNTDSFFRYNGSLTTGDYNEDVIWTIFDTPIAISERQLAKFRRLRDEHGNELIENVRSTQLLHDRVVMYRPQSNPSSPLLSLPDLISAIEFPLE
ncbi:carbonic anhydrase 2-like isoform X1 [Daphnia pulicaria]|uniref:carbonic anhydrase 2-like isoform X1 n=1 Tax=Daphnia pulicaria TaxID=35523 RepID=UPI001EEA3662|nr:carbonic anhydrase 2-like isoform X1 [Daphnia pulicaria]